MASSSVQGKSILGDVRALLGLPTSQNVNHHSHSPHNIKLATTKPKQHHLHHQPSPAHHHHHHHQNQPPHGGGGGGGGGGGDHRSDEAAFRKWLASKSLQDRPEPAQNGHKQGRALEANQPLDMRYTDRHYCSLADLPAKLARDGVAVVRGVLSEAECQQSRAAVFALIEELTADLPVPFDRNRKETWETFFTLAPKHSMLLQQWGIGQAQCSWDVRQNRSVLAAFEKIWQTRAEDLLVSFDGLSLALPHEDVGHGYFQGEQWVHTDQSSEAPGLQCVQGLVTLFDVNDGDATTLLIPGSHKLHQHFFERFGKKSNGDWYKMVNNESWFFTREQNLSVELIRARAGDLVLWDSRTFHSGHQPSKNRAKPNFRQAIYVCATPRAWATDEQLAVKRSAFEAGGTTSHWPHRAIKSFPSLPRVKKDDGRAELFKRVRPVPRPQLTDLGHRLAGF